MSSEKISFTNAQGHQLSAKLELPLDKKPKATAIFAHCFTCSKNLRAVKNIARGLTSEGIAVLLFDFTGLGNSEGNFEETNFSSNIEDLFAASSYLKENYQQPNILIGHSLGGAAALFAGNQMDYIQAVVTIGAPFDPYHVTKLLKSGLEEIESKGSAEINIGGRPFTINKTFIDDLKKHNPEVVAKSFRRPLLIFHSPQDETVSIENAAKIYTAAHHPKSFISLNGADHLLSKTKDSLYVGKLIGSWLRRYMDMEEDARLIETDSQVVVETPSDNFTTDIQIGKHRIIADEPKEVGGHELGPSPYGLLTAALGACTSMTLQMYAKRKGWNLLNVRVHVSHDKDYAKDCKDCESNSTKIDLFHRKIELTGHLDEAQRKRLLEIADKCPVHKTLHQEVEVITELMD